MPIASFIMTLDRHDPEQIIRNCQCDSEVEVHGLDDAGQAVLVIDATSSRRLEELATRLQQLDGVLSLVPVYLNAEDEIARIESGELRPEFSFGRKSEKPAPLS